MVQVQLMLAATIVLVLLTGVYVWLTHRILRSQTDPYVVVYARDDELRPTLIEIVVENVGRTVASDVTFEFSRPLPWRAFGTSLENATPAEEMTKGPLVYGIPALGPGASRRITWGQFGGLSKALGDDVVIVTARFKSGARELRPVVSVLDVKSFAGTDASTRDPGLRMLEEVRRVAEALERLEKKLPSATL